MTREQFQALLGRSVSDAIAKAQEEVRDRLPERVRFELKVQQYDGREATLEDVVGALYVDGQFPPVVDVGVSGATEDAVLVWVRPSAHAAVSDIVETWNSPAGMGPFKNAGLLLPSHFWNRQRPFSAADLREAAPAWAMRRTNRE